MQITRHAFSLASDQVSRQKFCESRDISKNSCAPRGVMDHDGIRNFEVVRFIRNTNIKISHDNKADRYLDNKTWSSDFFHA